MTWQAVARKDFRDAVRSKWLWALSLLFVLFFSVPLLLVIYLDIGVSPQRGKGTTDIFIFLFKEGVSILIPLIAIVVSSAAITGERETGSLKLLLSLPHSRDDVVFGKLVGRSAVVGLPIVGGFAVALLLLVLTPLALEPLNFLGFTLLTALLGIAFVGFSVGVSAAAGTNRRAMVATMGTYIVFVVLWNALANVIVSLLIEYAGMNPQGRYPTVLFIKLLNPTQAYKTLVDSMVMNSAMASRVSTFGLFNRQFAAKAFGDSLPVHLTDPFVMVYLLFWLFIPLALGYRKFQSVDL